MPREGTSRRRFVALVGTAASVGLAGCSSGGENRSTTAATTTTSTTRTTTTRTTTTTETTTSKETTTADGGGGSQPSVAMITDNKGSYFDPKGLLVEPGTTVEFVNESGQHTTTAYHPDNGDLPLRIPEAAEPWDSGLYTEGGKTTTVTFDVPGVYDYYCKPHEMMGMVGRIVVGEPQGGPATNEPSDLPPGATSKLPSIQDIVDSGTVAGP